MLERVTYPLWQTIKLPKTGRGIQESLFHQIRQAIAGGSLHKGIKLPSSRLMAHELGISRNTITEVYDRLATEGFLRTTAGSGTFVCVALEPAISANPRAKVQRLSSAAPISRRAQSFMINQVSSYEFGRPLMPGIPALDAFPYDVWARLSSRFWRKADARDHSYGDPAGAPLLRQAIAEYLGAARGIACSADQLIITNGTMAAVSLIAWTLCNEGDGCLVEDPGHFPSRQSLRFAGVRTIPVPVDVNGMAIGEVKSNEPDARMVLLTPAHQYPLGATLSLERRLQILQWARTQSAWIVEDDYDGEFHHLQPPISALKSLDRSGSVLYTGSLSKLLAPGLRLGFIIVPDRLIESFRAARAAVDRHPSISIQLTAATFIGNGHLASHIRLTRTLYEERRQSLLDALNSYDLPLQPFGDPTCGLHMALPLRPGSDDKRIVEESWKKGLGVRAMSYCNNQSARLERRGVIVGFASTPAWCIKPAVARLQSMIEKFRNPTAGGVSLPRPQRRARCSDR